MEHKWRPTMDRLILNNALLRLTQEWDFDTAVMIINEFYSLPGVMRNKTRQFFISKKSRTSVSGQTPEHGNISIGYGKDEPTRVGGVSESAQVRVGFFKIVRIVNKYPKYASIIFGSFQQDTESMLGLKIPATMYQLIYKTESNLPYKFSRLDWVKRTPSWKMFLAAFCMFLRNGKMPVMNCWRVQPVLIHVC